MSKQVDPTQPAGSVIQEGEQATLLFERVVSHAPDAVWEALTDPEQLRAWFVVDAVIDTGPSMRVEMVTGPAKMRWTGRILTWRPPRIFEYEWNLEPRDEIPQGERSIVKWELAPEGEGTRLRLTHRHLSLPTASGFAPGTHAFLDRLVAHLNGAVIPDWMERYAAVQSRYGRWGAAE